MNNIPQLNFPKKTVIKLIPDVYFCKEVRILMDIEKDKISFHEISFKTHKKPIESKQFLSLDDIEEAQSHYDLRSKFQIELEKEKD